MTSLILACLAFVGTHLLMSHPLRAPMLRTLGAGPFMGVYSLVSLACFIWIVLAFRAMPPAASLWVAGDALWAVSSLLMLVSAILFMGSLVRNPAMPVPNAAELARAAPSGIYTWTRHPMNWSFILWAIAHSFVSPRPAVLVLAVSIAALALIGSLGQDAKKSQLMGDAWRDYMARTAFVPFAKGISFPGMHALGGGLVVWLIATWAHPMLGSGMPVGLWHWIG